jgi:hypothetical protein
MYVCTYYNNYICPLEDKLVYTVCVCATNACAGACTRRVFIYTMVGERKSLGERKRRERESEIGVD